MEDFQYEIVTKPAYRGVGLKWDGSYEEVSTLKKVIDRMSNRAGELDNAVDPQTQLGLSYHLRPDGFVHYSVFEVNDEQHIPDGMVEIHVPEMTYLVVHHEKGQDIGGTYDKIFKWIKESDYIPYEEPNVDYHDPIPIKHERYPMDRDLNDPYFDILIPIEKKQ
ncbi:GyrI-like domain-containing protein [Virgibacillus doumboii]|uniref:GyrI-like domain-containing protein n=1 Tax=Virgibacillus doumboii TaxID=2697503 RepID=UPI0013DECDE6|nr:GyrI-like domain-containing protein [Virgibacillus doumboii]